MEQDKKVMCVLIAVAMATASYSQGVLIEGGVSSAVSAPDPSALLDVDVTGMTEKKGILLPRMTETLKLAISNPATSLLIFQTDQTPGFQYFDGSAWAAIGGWGLKGNSSIDDSQQYIGTSDANDFVIRTNGIERLRTDSDGHIEFKSASSANEFRFYEPSNSLNFTGFKAPALSTNVIYTLPVSQGATGEVLTNDGTGELSWSTPTATPAITPVAAITITNGSTNDNMNIGDASFIHLSGSNANFDITGFQGGTNGKMIIVYNTGNGHMRIQNEDSGSSAVNRIWTLRGGSGVLQTTSKGAVTFVYDGNVQRWIAVAIND